MKIAIATCETLLPYVHSDETSLLTHDDIWLVRELRRRGHEVFPLPWRRADSLEPTPDLVLLRSTWDYALHATSFLAWLEAWKARQVPIWNPYELVQWNGDKRYLEELAKQGVSVVPTAFVDAAEAASFELASWMEERGWREIVIKPAVGAGGIDTFRVARVEATAFQQQWDAMRRECWMIQPFVQEILEEGEWSLTFFGGKFSHAVRKFARPGEFRVQDDHGGHVKATEAPDWLYAQAAAICEAIPTPWLYARVDGVVVDGQLQLMELELIEPELFIRHSPHAPAMMADAIERVCNS